MDRDYHFEAIGLIHSCYKEKFGIPRQPGLVSEARATLELLPPYNRREALAGLEGFSHVWILFVFHGIRRDEWRPTVRPPRLGGNKRLGVFATRSTFRPNPIGLSVVELEDIELSQGKVLLHLRGSDLLDGTPVLDIKPYLPYADSVAGAKAGFAPALPEARQTVVFTPEAERQCVAYENDARKNLKALITQILEQDPRPAYRGSDDDRNEYGMRLYDFNLRWCVDDGVAIVLALDPT